jgi:hypothetical protein
VEDLQRVGEILVTSLQHVVSSRSLDRESELRVGFHALSRLLDRVRIPEVAAQAIAIAQDKDLSSAGQIALLVDLASAGGGAQHVRDALGAAIRIAADDWELAAILIEGLSTIHTPALTDLLIERHEPSHLVVHCGVSHLLDDAGRHKLYQRVASLDIYARLTCLDALLPHLEESKRRESVSTEISRKAEWSQDPEIFVMAICALAPNAPEVVRPHLDGLTEAFNRLEPSAKVTFAGLLAERTDFAREWIIDEAFETADNLDEWEKVGAITQLAPWLSPPLISHAVEWLSARQKIDIRPALAGLIRRAITLDDRARVFECLRASKNTYSLSDIIEEVAPELPWESLSMAADLLLATNSNGLGALAVRAAELGDMDLTLTLLDRKGNNTHSGDLTLPLIYQLSPLSCANILIDRAQELRPGDRARALVEMVNRVPRNRRRTLVESIVECAGSLWGAQNGERLRVIRAIEPELCRLPTSAVVSIWTEAMRRSVEKGREEVLVDVRAFTPMLISRFGPEIALKLDEAVCLGGGEVWP